MTPLLLALVALGMTVLNVLFLLETEHQPFIYTSLTWGFVFVLNFALWRVETKKP